MKKRVFLAVVLSAGLAASVALAQQATTQTILFGKSITLTGKTPSGLDPKGATVLSKPCGFTTFAPAASPPIASDGSVAYKIAPAVNTQYQIMIGNQIVSQTTIRVQPLITLKAVGGNRYTVTVTTGNGNGLGEKTVTLQRKTNGHWKAAGSARLKLTSLPSQIDAVSVGTGIARGAGPVRAVLGAKQASPCFAAGTSAAA